MCLTCMNKGRLSKKDKKEIFTKFVNPKKIILHNFDNTETRLTKLQVYEIIEHAIQLVVTGVDFELHVWAIQWENNYIVKSI